MGGGYVLNFSNRTFEEFFREVVGVKIYDPFYDRGTLSKSKANRLRAFWEVASESQLGLFFGGLLEGWSLYSVNSAPISNSAKEVIQQILIKLGAGSVSSEQQKSGASAQIREDLSERLVSHLMKVSCLPPHERGYEFEQFLKSMFDAYGLAPRAPFRRTGEQIDGSFVMHNETYLLEAKWQNLPAAAADLHTFQGKLGQKASWSRGLFVSISGFSEDGLEAFGKCKSFFCMDGFDLSEMLKRRLSVVDVLTAKVRMAAETGSPFVRVRDLSLK